MSDMTHQEKINQIVGSLLLAIGEGKFHEAVARVVGASNAEGFNKGREYEHEYPKEGLIDKNDTINTINELLCWKLSDETCVSLNNLPENCLNLLLEEVGNAVSTIKQPFLLRIESLKNERKN